ncbi:MAG: adenylyl-sulfate kinase [Saprospiraceae bacterium]
MSTNIHPIFNRLLQREDRESLLHQRSVVLWLTGLSGSGKSTIALELERKLFNEGFMAQVLDGDNIRSGINKNLGFSLEDREENIRRIAEVSKLYVNSGIITINSFVSPTLAIRAKAREIIGKDFVEVYVNAPLEICEKRDVKGLYKKARSGKIIGFTGIDSPYEPPQYADVEVFTENQSVSQSVLKIYNFILPMIQIS